MRASARPSWSASAQRRHAPPPWRWASPSATSAISRRRMKGEAVLLGVDVGGTTTAAGVVTRDGEVLIEQRASTHRDGKGRVLPTIVGLIAAVRAEAEGRGRAIAAIGVGVPGAVDPLLGRVGEPVPHVPELAGRALAAELSERFGLPAFVDNDVNALALGEWMFGAGRGAGSLVVLAPGTSFGAGIVLDGRVVRGAAGFGTVVNGLNPEVVVITGGVAESLVPLAAQILARAGEYAFDRALAATRVTIVPSDKRTSMRGAAALAIYEIERTARSR